MNNFLFKFPLHHIYIKTYPKLGSSWTEYLHCKYTSSTLEPLHSVLLKSLNFCQKWKINIQFHKLKFILDSLKLNKFLFYLFSASLLYSVLLPFPHSCFPLTTHQPWILRPSKRKNHFSLDPSFVLLDRIPLQSISHFIHLVSCEVFFFLNKLQGVKQTTSGNYIFQQTLV